MNRAGVDAEFTRFLTVAVLRLGNVPMPGLPVRARGTAPVKFACFLLHIRTWSDMTSY